jgi:hypothetical protein
VTCRISMIRPILRVRQGIICSFFTLFVVFSCLLSSYILILLLFTLYDWWLILFDLLESRSLSASPVSGLSSQSSQSSGDFAATEKVLATCGNAVKTFEKSRNLEHKQFAKKLVKIVGQAGGCEVQQKKQGQCHEWGHWVIWTMQKTKKSKSGVVDCDL